MDIMVIIEPDGAGYRARCRHPVEAKATGHSRYDARLALEAKLSGLISVPFTTLPLEVTPDKPWIATAGSIPDDPVTDEWLDAIAEYRRECDAEDQHSLPPASITQPTP
jgi:hypothetical protein